MRADGDKYIYVIVPHKINGSAVAGYVDTAASRIFTAERMIVKQRMKGIPEKEQNPFVACILHFG